MAAKRLREYSDEDQDDVQDQSQNKRVRRLPSLSSVIREAINAKSLQNLFFALEPFFRKVMQEEIERGLVQHKLSLQRPTQMQIEATESSKFNLIFARSLTLPIFTGSKIEDIDGNQLQIIIVDNIGKKVSATSLPSTLKLEVAVVDGDFQVGDNEDWSTNEFQKNIVKERTGRRPLLTGDVSITLRDGAACISELCFTDNSSWIRSRHFRIGVRIVPGSYNGPRIKEAITERFMVKDHRGELYRKHYPPVLRDEVWRLEKIGKDGAFHKKLTAEGINTVQQFLKLYNVDPERLRTILGAGMSDRVWEVTTAHAKTCELGNKVYLHHGPQCTLILNPVCEILNIVMGNMHYTLDHFNKSQKVYIQQLVREAYSNWDELAETDGLINPNIDLSQNAYLPQVGTETPQWY